MYHKFAIVAILAIAQVVYGFSGGAPEGVCDDMTPQHGRPPQTSKFPYTVSLSENQIKAEGITKITISGPAFTGFFLLVTDGDKPVGSFEISDDSTYAQSVSCLPPSYLEPLLVGMSKMFTGFIHNMMRIDISSIFPHLDPPETSKVHHNAATHKNSDTKTEVTLDWKAPLDTEAGKEYTVYATVSTDFDTYWVRQPTEIIKIT